MECSDIGIVQFEVCHVSDDSFEVVQSLCLSFLGSDGAVLQRAPGSGGLRAPSPLHAKVHGPTALPWWIDFPRPQSASSPWCVSCRSSLHDAAMVERGRAEGQSGARTLGPN